MKKILQVAVITLALLAIYFFVASDQTLGALNPNQTKQTDNITNVNLLSATTTAGNSGRYATSSPAIIDGAKKVTFQFFTEATSTAKATDFLIYASPSIDTPNQSPGEAVGSFVRFNNFVLPATSSPTTGGHYYARYPGLFTVNDGATTTAMMDIDFGVWRTVVCVASSTPKLESTCRITVER